MNQTANYILTEMDQCFNQNWTEMNQTLIEIMNQTLIEMNSFHWNGSKVVSNGSSFDRNETNFNGSE